MPFAPFLPKPLAFGSPQYFLISKLGSGSFGVAYIAALAREWRGREPTCQHIFAESTRLFVIKKFRDDLDPEEAEGKTDDEKAQLIATKKDIFRAERQRVAWLKVAVGEHPNLVNYLHDVNDEETGTQAMVFEYCNCGDIRRLIQSCHMDGKIEYFSALEAWHLAGQMANGVACLHKHEIVHRDLALRNVFLHCDGSGTLIVKIGDFGLCFDIGDKDFPLNKAKNGIREPMELDEKQPYTEKSDVYALGLVLYEVLSLVDLSHGTLYQINTTLLNKERVRLVSNLDGLQPQHNQFKDCLARMLSLDPKSRPSAQEVVDTLVLLRNGIAHTGNLAVAATDAKSHVRLHLQKSSGLFYTTWLRPALPTAFWRTLRTIVWLAFLASSQLSLATCLLVTGPAAAMTSLSVSSKTKLATSRLR